MGIAAELEVGEVNRKLIGLEMGEIGTKVLRYEY